ncbi:uncharacterized protein LOC127706791 [Mytilus californianus]|uniref:uncharacterized protein LOC127706791 n=1 Tax=Mytilus californianus TaxID=6549 RepID=UPI002247932D|nr:uncharacterized protein LOC127706791 [Mytilus californianus]
MSSTLSPVNTFSRRLDKTSSFLRSNTLQGITISTYSASQKSTFLSQLGSTSPALKETTGRSKMVPKTTSPSRDIQENTFPVLVESPSSDVPGKDEIDVVSEIVIIAIVAATILIVIVISVTVVFCKRKRNTQGTPLNQPMVILGREAVYEEANTPPGQHAGSTSQRFHPTASDDTYDHIDHCRPNQTHNPTESNYDTMRSTGTQSEKRNELNYDHVTGTKKASNI